MQNTKQIQRALKAAGFDPGLIDGDYGKNTRYAVSRFQESRGLNINGDADPITLAALFGEPAAPAPVSGLLTREVIIKVCPSASPALVNAIATNADSIAAAGITTPLRAAHFLSEIATETGGLRAIEENLNYSAKRLVQVFPSRFKTLAAAQPYANNPQALANKVYGGRLGNTQPGDGWRYRGGGLMQTTGRYNYTRAGHEDDPEALRQPVPALKSALAFWSDNGLNALADSDNVEAVRKRVNGGTNGIAETRIYLKKAKAALRA